MGAPSLSVVVAVHAGEEVLPRALAALAASDLPRREWELVVVDDASLDASAAVAARWADVVVRLPGNPRGPAYARNRGAEVARGDLLVFVDADVCVHPDVLGRFARLFADDPGLSAAFGSYDDDPAARGWVSQFRNLLHHYVHQKSGGSAETFWSGCGAIRRAALLDAGMFDEWSYSRPQVEDIEVGRRLRGMGHRIELHPEIQCTHLKRWTLRGMVATDFTSRGVPWMRMLLQEGAVSEFEALNLRPRERLSALLAILTVVALVAAGELLSLTSLAVAGLAAAGIVALNHGFYGYLLRLRGPGFLLAAVPLHLLYYLTAAVAAGVGYVTHALVGAPAAPPEVEAQHALGIDTWPPCPRRPAEGLWSAVPRTRTAPAREP
ncbi:MAG TPA: glycosyltransferase family 2 protein [Longimicrobiaceae bacterium]|nr:glycosyltransferase family 2 protein [Longimicrobiaceae bacterium]